MFVNNTAIILAERFLRAGITCRIVETEDFLVEDDMIEIKSNAGEILKVHVQVGPDYANLVEEMDDGCFKFYPEMTTDVMINELKKWTK